MGLGLAIAAAGGVGTLARYGVHSYVAARGGWPIPAGTFTVNVLGSLMLGFVLAKFPSHESVRLIVGLGFLGGFTTFSTLAIELHRLGEARSLSLTIAYGAGTVIAGIAAAYVGVFAARL